MIVFFSASRVSVCGPINVRRRVPVSCNPMRKGMVFNSSGIALAPENMPGAQVIIRCSTFPFNF